MTHNPQEISVFIAGGGLVGGVIAAYLKNNRIPFALSDPLSPETMLDAVADGRTTAISFGSQRIFKEAGLWTKTLDDASSPIQSIRVLEEDSINVLNFDGDDIGPEPMGYIVENKYIRESILSNLQDCKTAYYQTTIQSIEKGRGFVFVTLSNGMVFKTKLFISAEGRKSPTRDLIAPKMKTRDYAQTALVVHLEHEKQHHNRAWEIFTKDGPFAMLPLRHPDQKKSGIVYAKSTNFDWNSQTDLMLEEEMERIFPYYGKLKIVSKRWHFPLSVFELNTLMGDRQVLVGDAAHGMHPLAGQGVNLGWRDAQEISSLIIKHFKLGLDVGSHTLLETYERQRKKDIKMLLTSTDFMNEIFQHKSTSAYYLRNVGLSVVNQINPLKRYFMKKAMGI